MHPLPPTARARPHPFRFRFPAAAGADRPASGRPTQRLAPARRRAATRPVDRIFRDLPDLLRQGDLLVLNDTQVIKARLFGEKPTGGKVELLIERVLGGNQVAAHMRVSKKPEVGTTLALTGAPGSSDNLRATLLGPLAGRRRRHVPLRVVQRRRRRPLHADGAPRPRAAAALYRTRRLRTGHRALPDRVRAPRRRGGGAHGRAAFRRRAAGHARRARRARAHS